VPHTELAPFAFPQKEYIVIIQKRNYNPKIKSKDTVVAVFELF